MHRVQQKISCSFCDTLHVDVGFATQKKYIPRVLLEVEATVVPVCACSIDLFN